MLRAPVRVPNSVELFAHRSLLPSKRMTCRGNSIGRDSSPEHLPGNAAVEITSGAGIMDRAPAGHGER
jgi:hypothetical protein